ncbi:MAG: DUF4440 domain-containing protein [Acidobacteriota bacterium]
MQIRASHLLYVGLAVAVTIWLVGQRGGEKRQIEKRLGGLEALLDKDGPESPLSAANKATEVGSYFAREFDVILGGYGAGAAPGRQQIAQALLRYRTPPSRVEVTFRDVEIQLDQGERGADMTTIGVAAATVDGNLSRRKFRFAFRWIKEDRDWVIQRAELIEELDPGLF